MVRECSQLLRVDEFGIVIDAVPEGTANGFSLHSGRCSAWAAMSLTLGKGGLQWVFPGLMPLVRSSE